MGTITATYGYDSQNRRIRKTVGDRTVHYHYDVNNLLIAETLADGTILREYIYLDGEPLALKEYESSPGLYYFLNDHLGTPQQLVSTDGEVVWQAAYLPFGKAQLLIEQIGNNIRFPGQYFDNETGLHYNWNRYYDPETGRYISADPIGLGGGMNLYVYVKNDPVNKVDPMGLMGSKSQIPDLYELYKRYKKVNPDFKSCDAVLTSPMTGDCSEKCFVGDCYNCAIELCNFYAGLVGSPSFGICILESRAACAIICP